ncbi:MAG: hypothetical protein NTW21_01170 [Verrucomicrobia bacterium]|nr:hypothetical protein [Verrucomicrobiota bacterium]
MPERFRELVLECRIYQLEARAYDDGVAFRYLGGSGPECTDFQFAGDRLRQPPRQLSLRRTGGPISQCPHAADSCASAPVSARHVNRLKPALLTRFGQLPVRFRNPVRNPVLLVRKNALFF